jgi:hypothetical protein
VRRFWRRGNPDDLRPTWEERRVALERSRDRFRRQQNTDARRRAWVQRGLPIFTALCFAFGLAVADLVALHGVRSRPDLFTLRRLEVEGAHRVDPTELARAVLPADAPEPLTPDEIAARLEAHPWIAEAAVARLAPDAAVARVREYTPAAVVIALGETPALVDEHGLAFADAEGSDWSALPQLIVADLAPRDRRDPVLAQGVALARAALAAGFSGIEIALDGEDPNAVPALRIAGVPARIVLGASDPAPKLARLVRLLANEPSAAEAREIDLRFAEQVVLRPVALDSGSMGAGATAPGKATGVGAPVPATGGRAG